MNHKILKTELITKSEKERLYNINIPIIGLTGGIATGKSTVSKMFRDIGLPLLCADELVHNIYDREESLQFINSHWPSAVSEGKVDFKLLREIFFNDKNAKTKIEDFIYSHLKEEFLNSLKLLGEVPFVIYDVPLLFEKKLEPLIDLIVTVYCPKEEQIKRLIERDGIKAELAKQILQSQIDIEIKRKSSHKTIDNSGPRSKTQHNFNELIDSILRE